MNESTLGHVPIYSSFCEFWILAKAGQPWQKPDNFWVLNLDKLLSFESWQMPDRSLCPVNLFTGRVVFRVFSSSFCNLGKFLTVWSMYSIFYILSAHFFLNTLFNRHFISFSISFKYYFFIYYLLFF